MQTHMSIVFFALSLSASAACGDVKDETAGADGAILDAAAADGAPLADAPLPDAAAFACTNDDDCQEPPDACRLPGTCDEGSGTCTFPQKDCSELDGDCTSGACDPATGECIAEPKNEDAPCGAETNCQEVGDCDFGGSTCAESGTQALTCTDFTCQAGECTAGDPYDDSASCSRDTEDDSCDQELIGCTVCQGDCSGGTQTCDFQNYACSNGSCEPSSTTSQSVSCSTQGQFCGSKTCGGTAAEPQTCATCCEGSVCSTTCCGPCM